MELAKGMDTAKDFHRFGHRFGGGRGPVTPVVSDTDRRVITETTQNNRMEEEWFHHTVQNLAHGYVVNRVLYAVY